MSKEMSLKDRVIEALNECNLVNNYGDYHFTCEIYADYRDEIDNSTIEKICESEDPELSFYDYLEYAYDDAEYYELTEITDNVINYLDKNDLLNDGEKDDIKDIVFEMVECVLPVEHYWDQEVKVDITVDTGDWNYEFAINQIEPAFDGEDLDTEIPKESSIRWLAETQGYSEKEMRDAFKGYEENGVLAMGFLPSMYIELENVVTHMNALVILAEMSLGELIELNIKINEATRDKNGNPIYNPEERPDCGSIHISKNAMLGLYDSWNGGGSVLEIELEKDFDLPFKYICEAMPDVTHAGSYSINECYGLCDSAWKDVVTGIFA